MRVLTRFNLSTCSNIGDCSSTCSLFQEVHVDIDTDALLSKMMTEASRVVGTIASMSNIPNSSILISRISRSESQVAMPPPLPKKPTSRPKWEAQGLDLLSKTATDLPIVSPDISALKSPVRIVPDIHFHEEEKVEMQDNESDEDLPELSLDQCADIVDCVFGDLDDLVLMGPPMKKPKRDSF
jgi:hypothetical protein